MIIISFPYSTLISWESSCFYTRNISTIHVIKFNKNLQHTENFSEVLFLKEYTNYNTMGMPLERKLDLVIKAISIFSARFLIFLPIFPTSLINDAASP